MTPFQKQFGELLKKSRREKIAARKQAAQKKRPKPKAASATQLQNLVGRFNQTP